MNDSFWSGRRVLLTGHTGFKGSWMSLWLQSMGAELTGYSLRAPTDPSLFEVAGVAGGMNSIEGDIRDLVHMREVVTDSRPEIVIHMAAQPLVRRSYKDPVETYSSNVMGTVNLFEAVRKADSVRAVVNITSDKCYENREWIWGYREHEPMGGYDPYSSSKGCAELVTSAYRNSFFHPDAYADHGVAVASARAGNVIGGGDWADDRLMPDIMRAIIQGRPVRLRNPNAVRPWQHVLEPLSGYLALARALCEKGSGYSEGWNFGPGDGDALSVLAVTQRLTEGWGEGAHWIIDDDDHPHEAHYLKLDSSKARSRLGWRPLWSLDDALGTIVDWYRAYHDGKDMHKHTCKQIETYHEKLKGA